MLPGLATALVAPLPGLHCPLLPARLAVCRLQVWVDVTEEVQQRIREGRYEGRWHGHVHTSQVGLGGESGAAGCGWKFTGCLTWPPFPGGGGITRLQPLLALTTLAPLPACLRWQVSLVQDSRHRPMDLRAQAPQPQHAQQAQHAGHPQQHQQQQPYPTTAQAQLDGAAKAGAGGPGWELLLMVGSAVAAEARQAVKVGSWEGTRGGQPRVENYVPVWWLGCEIFRGAVLGGAGRALLLKNCIF